MRALSSRPFCSCDGRRVSLRYLSAVGRYTASKRGLLDIALGGTAQQVSKSAPCLVNFAGRTLNWEKLHTSRTDPYQNLVEGAGGGWHGCLTLLRPPPARCPAHPLTEGSVWVSSPVPALMS